MIESRRSHFMLLQFIATEDDQFRWAIFVEHEFYELSAERASTSSHQNYLL
jgi:hypothetical protein